MRTTLDFPDALYRQLKATAAREGCSVKAFVLRSVKGELNGRPRKRGRRVTGPIVGSHSPGTLIIDSAKIAELILP